MDNNIFINYSQISSVFEYLSLGVLILSQERRIVSMNRPAELLTGYNLSDVGGKYCYEVFCEYLCGGTCRFLEHPNSTIISDMEITDQENGKTCITKIETPLFGAENQFVGCLEVFQDHSVFRELIQRIRFDDLRLKIILDNLNIGVMTVDRANLISFFNAMAENITGFSRSEVLGKPCNTIFGKKFGRNISVLRKLADKQNIRSGMEGKIITRSGNTVPVQANYISLKNEEKKIVGGLITLSDLSLKYQFDSAIKDRYTFYDMVGKDPVMQKLFDIIPVIAAKNVTILIEGPTGTGKDILAKIIHNASPRAGKPLVKVNCAALPDNLLESEMFGYVKGAFTGADRDKPGRFNEAEGGTIFLDEIGDLPLSLQAKLLRVLEDREFYPLGSRKTSKVDVRIISATNQNLEKLILEKRFREDLFYRLNVMRLELPPLRERKGDIPLLISHIIKRICATRGTKIKKISEDAMEVLLNYDYPGNIRELENILEHALIICRGPVIERKHFPIALLRHFMQKKEGKTPEAAASDSKDSASDEKHKIISMLKKYNWHKGKTAQALGINRSTLWRKMKRWGIGN